MNAMSLRRTLLLMLVGPVMSVVHAQDVDEAPLGETVERHLPIDEPYLQWVQDPDVLATETGDQVDVREVIEDKPETIKLTGLVPPIQFESGVAKIPDTTVVELAGILERMRHRRNVRLHLVGHADNRP